VRLDTSLVSRTLLVDLIHDQINRIYYILLAMLTDAHIETTSDYWLQFGMTGVGKVYPTTQVVNGITVPLNDFTIQPTTNVVTYWQHLVDEISVCPVYTFILFIIESYTKYKIDRKTETENEKRESSTYN